MSSPVVSLQWVEGAVLGGGEVGRNQSQSWGTPWAASASPLQMVSDVLSIKITTGQTQINLTDLTDRVKQAEDRISLNENKLLAYEKDLKLRLQKLTRNLEQIHRAGRGDGGEPSRRENSVWKAGAAEGQGHAARGSGKGTGGGTWACNGLRLPATDRQTRRYQ